MHDETEVSCIVTSGMSCMVTSGMSFIVTSGMSFVVTSGMSFWSLILGDLPNGHAFSLGHEHAVLFGDAEGLVPGIDVGQGTVYAPLAQ